HYFITLKQIRGATKLFGIKEKEEVFWGNGTVWHRVSNKRRCDTFTEGMLFAFWEGIKEHRYDSLGSVKKIKYF
ncbi:hypothetical protein ACFL0W_04485, partial [Nanoarchaeota archaeon]